MRTNDVRASYNKSSLLEEGSMDRKLCSCLALALLYINLAGTGVNGQSASAPFAFHSGQSMYIVAFRRERQPVLVDPAKGAITPPDYVDLELDAERRVRTR